MCTKINWSVICVVRQTSRLTVCRSYRNFLRGKTGRQLNGKTASLQWTYLVQPMWLMIAMLALTRRKVHLLVCRCPGNIGCRRRTSGKLIVWLFIVIIYCLEKLIHHFWVIELVILSFCVGIIWLSVPAQSITWKDSCPKWPVMCQLQIVNVER